MKTLSLAVAVAFSLGFAVASRAQPSPPPGCKASGHACSSAEECCSRMCRKDTGKCG